MVANRQAGFFLVFFHYYHSSFAPKLSHGGIFHPVGVDYSIYIIKTVVAIGIIMQATRRPSQHQFYGPRMTTSRILVLQAVFFFFFFVIILVFAPRPCNVVIRYVAVFFSSESVSWRGRKLPDRGKLKKKVPHLYYRSSRL